ncbi:phosphoadenosine phosphosulfate reductase family protein [Butyricicoccus faecihominis]|uniref:phosphoadenosine phosphosulfate reductase family protein n=1 Tax=Butyricicoccus faecihominis TaxID=1712515 RepID=UPI002478F508|nr:phosphoadenosine phosphosulfate reductase family protein [Butyricicoccus faecihominis]MCQ5130313.1 phosphoadenosine phosphosulfate reductase family protein [Butyricicoccus faecihominis]
MADLEHKSIARLQLAAQMSEEYYNAPLIVTTSGGKDSDVCIALARAAGIRFEVQHNHTTADAPETVRHVREQFRRLEAEGIKCTINWPAYKGQPVTMWSLIPQKLIPPTRLARYCCEVLKEGGGAGRLITTGVRWAESVKRKKKRGIYESMPRDINKKIILNNDNDDTRQLFENCKLQAKRVCNPVVDWADADVWDYIHAEKIQMNPLYKCGFKRVGCIGCPIAGRKGMQFEFARYPTYERAYIRAFDAMLAERQQRGKLDATWRIGHTGRDIMHWWLADGVLPGQMEIEGGV